MFLKRLECLLILLPVALFIFGCASTEKLVKDTANSDSVAETPSGAEGEAAPRIAELILGPGDRVDVSVYRNDDLKFTQTIGLSGKIIVPMVGDVQAAGLSVYQLRDKLREGLSKYIVAPQIYVGVASTQSQKIMVLGEVKTPGIFQAEGYMTALDIIARAGGTTLDGKKQNVLLIRGTAKKPQVRVLDLEQVFAKGDLKDNAVLQPGDIIYVPRTFISNVDRFFTHLSTILSPFLQVETGYFLGQQINNSTGSPSITPK
ncbi:polysaccharide export protein [bacterium]|nr:MAG: polysaccharide export protein [bacterium]